MLFKLLIDVVLAFVAKAVFNVLRVVNIVGKVFDIIGVTAFSRFVISPAIVANAEFNVDNPVIADVICDNRVVLNHLNSTIQF